MPPCRRETRTPEADFADTAAEFVAVVDGWERGRARTLARALVQAHLSVTDVVTVVEHAGPGDDNPYPDRCAAWRMECTADGLPLTVRYDWLAPDPHTPWTITVNGANWQLPERKGRYFTGTAQRLAPVIRELVRAAG